MSAVNGIANRNVNTDNGMAFHWNLDSDSDLNLDPGTARSPDPDAPVPSDLHPARPLTVPVAPTTDGGPGRGRRGMAAGLRSLGLAALAAVLALPVAAQQYDLQPAPTAVPRGDLVVRGLDAVWTANGDVLENASILIRDGVIRELGATVDVPDGVPVIDGAGMTAIPGLVDEHSHIAMSTSNECTSAIVPEVRVIDQMDPEDFNIYRALSGGVTTAQVLHGSCNPIGGQSAIIKARWGMADSRSLLVDGAPQTVKFALGENVTRKGRNRGGPERFPASRQGVEALYVQAFTAAEAYRDAWRRYREDPDAFRVPPRRDLRLEALVGIMEGRIRVHAHSYRADEIVMLMRVAERFGFTIDVFTHVLEGYKVADELAEHGAGASTFSDWWQYKLEAYDAIPYNATIMHRHGVLTSLNSDIPWLQSSMTYEFQKPVKYGGVSKEESLRMLTLYPAQQLHIADKVGTLEVGKHGDVVLLSGDPFDTYSRVETTIVDGVVYYDRERDGELRGQPVDPLPSASAPRPVAAPVAWRDARRLEDAAAETPRTASDPQLRGPAASGGRRAAGLTALVGGTVHPVEGPSIPDGVVLMEDGRITAVGPASRVEIPAAARRVDTSGRHVYPGMIDATTQLGLFEIGQIAQARDEHEVGAYNPHTRAMVGMNPHSVAIPVARANGITAAITSQITGVIPGMASLIQLEGDTPERLSLLDRAALRVNFPEAEGNAWEEAKLEGDRLEELVALFERAALYGARPTTPEDPTAPFEAQADPNDRIVLESLVPVLRGDIPAFFHAVRTEREIRTLLLFLDEFPDIRPVIVGGDQAFRVAEELAERQIPVVLGSILRPTMDRNDPVTAGWENAAILHAAGVPVAFGTPDVGQPSDEGVGDVRNLPYHAAKAAAYGLPREIALRAVTLTPAEILGLGSEMGSIEVGKRADLIVTDGDPLQIVTRVERIFIDGREVDPGDNKHTRLYEAFRDRH